jgi:O-antigen/teichoic acid export membrane protein
MPGSPNASLHSIAKGSTIVFAGVIASLALNFLLRVALVRYTTEDQYGIYSLATTVVGVNGAIAMLGLDEGSARYIAYYAGKGDPSRAGKVVAATLKIAIASGLAFAALLFAFADPLATMLFHTPGLGGILKIVAAAVPLTVLLQILTAVLRGYSETWSRAFFRDTLRTVIFLGLLAGIILLQLSFDSIIYAYVLSMAAAFIALVVFSARRLPARQVPARQPGIEADGAGITRSLLSFSFPMLTVSLLMLTMSQATALILAFFTSPADVGKYDVAITLASLLLVVINSLGYIYTPVASGLFGKGSFEEIRQSYVASTRWGYVLTVPMLFAFLLFPGAIVTVLFGERYASVAIVLQVIAIGYMVNPLTGPNYHTLIAAGRTLWTKQN